MKGKKLVQHKNTSNKPRFRPEIQALIDQHPCYSGGGFRNHARIHLPVAVGCNIQCNYCDRRYDCVNESRPGVTSQILTPDEAVDLVARVLDKIPQVSVVGIAGPGDPLANPDTTLRTLALVQQQFPQLKLCLSTNGLTLANYADDLAELNVEYVTVTVNTIDPHTAARIYSWVRWDGQRLTGMDAAETLLARQLIGLQCLADLGILVKVNSVLMPGINDKELPAIAQAVRDLGATLLNIMPLVRAPGSQFEDMPTVTRAQLEQARQECAAIMPLMKHCQQCRADAIGFLQDDRSAEFLKPASKKASCDCPALPVREPCCG